MVEDPGQGAGQQGRQGGGGEGAELQAGELSAEEVDSPSVAKMESDVDRLSEG